VVASPPAIGRAALIVLASDTVILPAWESCTSYKRDSGTRFFASDFFHESVSPKPLIIPLGPFRIFLNIHEDIGSSRFATGVVDTGGKWKKSSMRIKFFLSCQQFDNCSHCLPPVSTMLAKLVEKFASRCH
jgi:hypothetical protein